MAACPTHSPHGTHFENSNNVEPKSHVSRSLEENTTNPNCWAGDNPQMTQTILSFAISNLDAHNGA